MKNRILAIIVIALIIFNTFTVSAATVNYEYSISPGSDFIAVEYGDDLTRISQKLNMTADELNTYFNKNGLLYLAVSNDTKTQIRLSAFTDNFSSAVDDISLLSDEQLHDFIDAVSDQTENSCEVVICDGRKYIAVTDVLKDSGGVYTVTQYITICSGQTFYLACYNDGEGTSSQVRSIFENFSLKTVTVQNDGSYIFLKILIGTGILIFAAISVVMITGVIKSLRKNRE